MCDWFEPSVVCVATSFTEALLVALVNESIWLAEDLATILRFILSSMQKANECCCLCVDVCA